MSKIQKKIKYYINFLFTGIFFLLISCSSSIEESKEIVNSEQPLPEQIKENKFIQDSSLIIGELNKNVFCKNDPQNSYTLYVPATQKTNGKYPLIIFFDSHAKGALPVLKYRTIADKYGFILAGSNYSKNGMATEITTKIGKTIIEDIITRLPIDSRRIYAGGFSGGARVATAFADTDSRIKAVIGCSAGLPQQGIKNNFDFLGIAGTSDMNYLEMEQTNNRLEGTGMRHFLLLFEGKHEWAPEKTMDDAFLWLTFNAMKDHIIPSDSKEIDAFRAKENNNIASKNIFTKLQALIKISSFLDGLADISKEKNQLAELQMSKEFQTYNQNKSAILIKENSLQQAYLKAMQSQKKEWWSTEINKLTAKKNSAGNNIEKAMYGRVLSFLSLVSFSYVNNSLRENNLSAAEHFCSIYEIIDPENPDVYYFQACIYAIKKEKTLAFSYLEKSVSKGFNDSEKLNTDPYFKNIKKDKKFIDIVKTINNKND